MHCFENKELVRQFDRLWGTSLGKRLSPVHFAIDEATGKLEHDLGLFVAFVDDCIWQRLPDEAFVDAGVA
jgi:hypothetical protein